MQQSSNCANVYAVGQKDSVVNTELNCNPNYNPHEPVSLENKIPDSTNDFKVEVSSRQNVFPVNRNYMILYVQGVRELGFI